jgi:hypothetical protein
MPRTAVDRTPGGPQHDRRSEGAYEDDMTISSIRAKAVGLLAALTGTLAAAGPALGHHSFAMYDTASVIEIEGELAEIRWRNPHVRFTLNVSDATGAVTAWELESSSPGMLDRMDVPAELLQVGDRVRAAGNPAADGAPELFATNLLLSSGREVLLRFRDQPRWASDRAVGNQGAWFVTEGDASSPELGLFRIWSSTFAVSSPPLLFPDNTDPTFSPLDYPLTEEARAIVAAFDPVAASEAAAAGCEPKGMPWIMEAPEPVEFVDEGERILFRISEFNTERVIHMAEDADVASAPPSLFGVSTGVWEDGALVVRTTKINEDQLNFRVPQSEAVALVERFTPSADGARLDYEIEITDPATFTEPVRLAKHWIYIEGAELATYECASG